MDIKELNQHWDEVYAAKDSHDMSWYEAVPQTSLDLIADLNLDLDAAIIDVGGGDGRLAEHLLSAGYTDITVLDISQTALKKAQERLGDKASRVRWIQGNAAKFRHDRKYDLWHDRATFHFLDHEHDINDYCYAAEDALNIHGYAIVGVFAPEGPDSCSSLPVKRYSADKLALRFVDMFAKIKCVETEHRTPSGTAQPFVFCTFRRK